MHAWNTEHILSRPPTSSQIFTSKDKPKGGPHGLHACEIPLPLLLLLLYSYHYVHNIIQGATRQNLLGGPSMVINEQMKSLSFQHGNLYYHAEK